MNSSAPRTVPLPDDLPDDLAQGCPVRFDAATGAWWFTSHRAGEAILSDPSLSLDHLAGSGISAGDFGAHSPAMASALAASGERHGALREAAAQALSDPAVAQLRPWIIELAHRVAGGLPAHATSDGVVDLVERYVRPVAFAVIAELLGLEAVTADIFATCVWGWVDTELHSRTTEPVADRAGQPAWDTWQAVLDERRTALAGGAQRRAGVLDDLLGQQPGRRNGASFLTDDDIIGTVHLLATTGAATIAATIAAAILRVHRREQWADLAALPALAEYLALDTAKYEPPFPTIERVAISDTDISGQRVAAGDRVILNVVMAQQDPDGLPEGGRIGDAWEALLMWGRGDHRCPGAALAVAAVTEALQTLVVSYPRMGLVSAAPRRWGAPLPCIPHLLVRLS